METQQTDFGGAMGTRKPKLTILILMTSLFSLPGLRASAQAESESLANEVQTIKSILDSFLAGEFDHGARVGFVGMVVKDLEVLERGFSRTRGAWAAVQVGSRRFGLSLSEERVDWMTDSDQIPKSLATYILGSPKKRGTIMRRWP